MGNLGTLECKKKLRQISEEKCTFIVIKCDMLKVYFDFHFMHKE